MRVAPRLARELVSPLGRVVRVHPRAAVDVGAVVAHVRRAVVVLAAPLGLELLAVPVAEPALAALAGAALAARAHAEDAARVALRAPVLPAEPARPLEPVVAVRLDFAHHGRAGDSGRLCDFPDFVPHAQPVFYYNTLREGEMLSFLLHLVSYSVVLGYGRHANNPKVAGSRIGNLFVLRKGEVVDIGARGPVPPPDPLPAATQANTAGLP